MLGKRIGYYLFLFFIQLIKIIPFGLLYCFADFMYFLMYYVFSYRKPVIDKNLAHCFPEKSDEERKCIRKKFYKSLSDIMVETFKGYTMRKKELEKRFISINHEQLMDYFNAGKDIFTLTAHFANWEWGNATITTALKHQPAVLYKPISNPFIEKYVKKSRSRFGTDMISIYHSMRYLLVKKPKPVSYYLVADQYPTTEEKQKVVSFFGNKTPFLHGPEDFSNQMDVPVFYLEIKRIKRGYYSMEFFKLTDSPKELKNIELTQLYANYLEKSIRKQPEDWMWSHKRWKKVLYAFD